MEKSRRPLYRLHKLDDPLHFELKPEYCPELFHPLLDIRCERPAHQYGVCSAVSRDPYYSILWQSPNKKRFRDES